MNKERLFKLLWKRLELLFAESPLNWLTISRCICDKIAGCLGWFLVLNVASCYCTKETRRWKIMKSGRLRTCPAWQHSLICELFFYFHALFKAKIKCWRNKYGVIVSLNLILWWSHASDRKRSKLLYLERIFSWDHLYSGKASAPSYILFDLPLWISTHDKYSKNRENNWLHHASCTNHKLAIFICYGNFKQIADSEIAYVLPNPLSQGETERKGTPTQTWY